MKNNLSIHLILTGGTIDSFYDATKDTVVPVANSVIPDYVKSLKLDSQIKFTTVCMKDSRQLNESDRKNILEAIEKRVETKIIITHGTYTMPDTARYLKTNLKRNDQTIILTGSMIPLVGFSPPDAPFNLGFAIAELTNLKPGIYVAMNGKIFDPEEVIKDLSEGKFSSIFQK